MRYIGNKENIIEKIYSILLANNIIGESFFDFFSGTTSVAKYYKSLGYKIYSSDILYMSYCLQKAYIENNREPEFNNLLSSLSTHHMGNLFSSPLDLVLGYLNNIEDTEGFIYKNYTPKGTANLEQPRMYFSDENGKRIDAIRQQIELWKNENLLTELEYYILISCLIESISFYANVAGIYAAFYKKWDPRATKQLQIRPIKFIFNNHKNTVYHTNSSTIAEDIDVDILYLDPPYNQRQYLPNYHLIETIAKYDSPNIKGVTGMRDYSAEKSAFCNAKTALIELEKIIQKAKFKHLVMSYNSEGIMLQDEIISTMKKYGNVKLEQFEYTRFKSNNSGLSKTKKHVYEQLYILSK